MTSSRRRLTSVVSAGYAISCLLITGCDEELEPTVSAPVSVFPDSTVNTEGWPTKIGHTDLVDVAAKFVDQKGNQILEGAGVTWRSDADSIVQVTSGTRCNGEPVGGPNYAAGLHACLHGIRVGTAIVSVAIHQAGIQDTTQSFQVRVNERWTQVAANRRNTCAVNARGRLFCWGGHLTMGNGGNGGSSQPVPVTVLGSQEVDTIVSRDYTTCVKVALIGTPYCWGFNHLGQAGLGQGLDGSSIPQPIFGGAGFDAIAVGDAMSCGTTRGTNPLPFVLCWGRWDGNGLGLDPNLVSDGRFSTSGKIPPAVSHPCTNRDGLQYTCVFNPGVAAFYVGTRALVVGKVHACAVAGDSLEPSSDPQIQTLVAQNSAYAPLLEAALVWCWGRDSVGQLGSTVTDPYDPIQTSGLRAGVRLPPPNATNSPPLAQIVAIGAGAAHTCASLETRDTYCWGSNALKQSGGGTELESPPSLVAGVTDLRELVGGTGHSCGIDRNGRAFCWGDNTFGELGAHVAGGCNTVPAEHPEALPPLPAQCSSTAVEVEGGYRFLHIVTGSWHTCGITAPEGAIVCWGLNDWGQLGIGSSESTENGVPHFPQRILEPDEDGAPNP